MSGTRVATEVDLRSMLRDAQDGQAKPRSLALDVFGDYVRYHGGELTLRALVELLDCFGVAEATTRMMMSRLRTTGVFTTRRDGRKTAYGLTADGVRILDEGRQRIFDRGQSQWSGVWSLVVYTVPESDRAARERLRRALQWLGFGQLVPGTWISPHDRLDELQEGLREEDFVRVDRLRASSLGLDHDRALAARCWDLQSLSGAYQHMFDRITTGLARYRAHGWEDRDAFVTRMRLVHEYRMFPYRDPDLPAELLPGGWPGTAAHGAFLEAHEMLGPSAESYFLGVVRDVG